MKRIVFGMFFQGILILTFNLNVYAGVVEQAFTPSAYFYFFRLS